MNHSASHLTNSNDVVNWCKQNLSHDFNERMGNVRRFFWNIAMCDVDRSMPHNCIAILKTRGLHSIRRKKMENINKIEKRKYSCFCLACIDYVDSLDECQNLTNKFVKPWRHQELTPLPPFGNISDVEHDNKALVIDKYHDRVFYLFREADVFSVIAPVDNPKKKCIIIF